MCSDVGGAAAVAACFAACLTHFTSYVRRFLCKNALVLLFFKTPPLTPPLLSVSHGFALGIVLALRFMSPP